MDSNGDPANMRNLSVDVQLIGPGDTIVTRKKNVKASSIFLNVNLNLMKYEDKDIDESQDDQLNNEKENSFTFIASASCNSVVSSTTNTKGSRQLSPTNEESFELQSAKLCCRLKRFNNVRSLDMIRIHKLDKIQDEISTSQRCGLENKNVHLSPLYRTKNSEEEMSKVLEKKFSLAVSVDDRLPAFRISPVTDDGKPLLDNALSRSTCQLKSIRSRKKKKVLEPQD